jgi:chemotaxis protein CheD
VSQPEIFVGMGELAATADASDVLTILGLGSCVGIALVDASGHAAGLAHVMFPRARQTDVDQPGRYADTAVAALLAALARLGSPGSRLCAVLAGGARMFAFQGATSADIGTTNLAATHDALALAGIPICASATGGGRGRSIRIRAGDGVVHVREAGVNSELYRPPGALQRKRSVSMSVPGIVASGSNRLGIAPAPTAAPEVACDVHPRLDAGATTGMAARAVVDLAEPVDDTVEPFVGGQTSDAADVTEGSWRWLECS